MKIVIEIPDSEASFGLKVLQSLSFVKKANPMGSSAAAVWADLKSAANQVQKHKQGKIKLKTARELLNEL